MEYTFGGKYKLEEEIGFGGCGTFAIRPETFLLFLSLTLSKIVAFFPFSVLPGISFGSFIW